jgi:predicted TIM-barrel fold metal-dependent hydrolase
MERRFRADGAIPSSIVDTYFLNIDGADRAFVLALDGRRGIGHYWSNEAVAWLVGQDPGRLVGFASVDPSEKDAPDRLERAVNDLGMRGLKLAPVYQGFRPDDEAVFPVYERASRLHLPVIIHQGTSFFGRDAPMEEILPRKLDRVAREFPELKIVIAHLGYPWGGEVVALLRKHENVYADCSALAWRPSYLFRTLIDALEYSALDRVLFGSDFPPLNTATSRDVVLGLSRFTEGTKLPGLPADKLRDLVERDSCAVLGLSG